MQFVSNISNTNYYQRQKPNNEKDIMPFSASYRRTIQNNQSKQSSFVINNINVQPTAQKLNPPKKMKWGEPTWFLFHTLAEKVKENNFQSIRLDLINLITIICSNLPCPDCANHATDYMKKINPASIRTKQDLKLMLFQFHNVVNQKKNFPLFPFDNLDSKYFNANTVNIIQNFIIHFQDKHHSIRMIANDLYRFRITEQLKLWFNNNLQYFEL
jgi:hypothetical protein